MERVKTVVFVNHTAQLGGAEFALKRLVTTLDRGRWNPVVVFGESGPAVEVMRELSIETYVIPMGSELGSIRKDSLTGSACLSLRRWTEALGYIAKLRRFFRKRAVDLVHTNSLKAHVLGGIAAKISGIPLVWHLRDSVEESYLPKQAVLGMRLLAKLLPNRVVGVSESVLQSLFGCYRPDRGEVIYDGLDLAAFRSSLAEEPVQSRTTWKVGMVGRLTHWKRQHLFIQAATSLRDRGFAVDFEILGSALFGEEQYATGLHRQVSLLGMDKQIKFLGFVQNVSAHIQNWDICVHASTSPDPCPNVVIEAMAAGVPVVASAGGGVPELLDGGWCGELCRMGNSQDMAQILERLLNAPDRRRELAQRALDRAKKLFRSERVSAQVMGIWGALTDNKTWAQRVWPWIEEGFPLPAAIPTQKAATNTRGDNQSIPREPLVVQ